MRVIAASLLVVTPALVSAVVVPVRRDNTGYGTWYYTQTGNAGSCGSYLSDTDYTVAMNSFQYNDGMCGKTISITANGKTTQARVMDLCPNGGGNCNWGDVDMSPALFSYFAPQGDGKIPISWVFTDNSAPAPAPDPTTTPSTTTSTSQNPPPQVPTLPTHIDSAAVNYKTPTETLPTDPPVVAADATPTPQPDTTSTSCTDTDTWTSTESASAADVTPTPTPPTLADQVAAAMNNGDVYGLGGAFVQLGNMLQNAPAPSR